MTKLCRTCDKVLFGRDDGWDGLDLDSGVKKDSGFLFRACKSKGRGKPMSPIRRVREPGPQAVRSRRTTYTRNWESPRVFVLVLESFFCHFEDEDEGRRTRTRDEGRGRGTKDEDERE